MRPNSWACYPLLFPFLYFCGRQEFGKSVFWAPCNLHVELCELQDFTKGSTTKVPRVSFVCFIFEWSGCWSVTGFQISGYILVNGQIQKWKCLWMEILKKINETKEGRERKEKEKAKNKRSDIFCWQEILTAQNLELKTAVFIPF